MTTTTPILVGYVPATVPFGRAKGKASKRVLLHQSNGHYRCRDCGLTRDTYQAVWSHLRAHATRPAVQEEQAPAPKPSRGEHPFDLGQELAQLAIRVERLHPADPAALAAWKKRAQDAERKLRALRKALGIVDAS